MARFSKKSLEGYLIIDNRHAPSIDVATAAAFEATHGPLIGAGLNGVMEFAVLTCSHCQRGIVPNPQRERPRNWCSHCDKYVCDSPACNVGCRPLRALMDEARRSEHPLILTT